MAVKIIETKTGEVIKTSKQVKRDRTIRKVQKYISVFAVVMLMLMVSAVTVFATGGTGATPATPATNTTPAGVDTSTMSQFDVAVWHDYLVDRSYRYSGRWRCAGYYQGGAGYF